MYGNVFNSEVSRCGRLTTDKMRITKTFSYLLISTTYLYTYTSTYIHIHTGYTMHMVATLFYMYITFIAKTFPIQSVQMNYGTLYTVK